MAATYYVIPTEVPSDLNDNIISFLADAFDKAVSEGVTSFVIIFKEWAPGAAGFAGCPGSGCDCPDRPGRPPDPSDGGKVPWPALDHGCTGRGGVSRGHG